MILNRKQICEFTGWSPNTLDSYIAKGCPFVQKSSGRGNGWKFDSVSVLDWHTHWKLAQHDGSERDYDIEEARRRKMSAEATLAELELAKAMGEVALIREFESAHAKLMAVIRANVMNVPSRAVLQLLGETDETVFKTRLRAELTLALEQAAEAELELDDEDADG
jgi:terminase small subunit / prophage DNA-packing protein